LLLALSAPFLAYAQTSAMQTGAAQTAAPLTSVPAATQQQATDDADVASLTQELAVLSGDPAGSSSAAASTNDEGPSGIVPEKKGFNASIGTTSQHDSSVGWSNTLTPNVAFRFDRHFSFNSGVPIYTYILTDKTVNVLSSKGVVTGTSDTLGPSHLLLGDTFMDFEFEAHPKLFDYNLSTTVAAPTGNYVKGVGAGAYTYLVNNHFERDVADWLTPELELGMGNSVNLVNQRIRRSFETIGTNAHFQFGFGFSMPFHTSFTTAAYEELPLTTQTVTSTTTNGKKGKQLKIITTNSQESVGEDNGFINTLDIPLTTHVTLSGFYNRSLRDHDDTAGFSITFFLRAHDKKDH
jgi:hypothetical protein